MSVCSQHTTEDLPQGTGSVYEKMHDKGSVKAWNLSRGLVLEGTPILALEYNRLC